MAGQSTESSQLLELTLVQSTLVASGTVLVYDILCTLDQEIAHVWSNPRAVSSILFLLNRYLPLIDTFLSLSLKFSNSISPENCRRLFAVVTWFIVMGTLISEAILMLRTYAIWERRRWVLITLGILALVLYIPAIIVTALEVQSLIFAPNDTPIPGCHLIHASSIIFFAYILLVVAETVMVILTMIQAYRYMRERTRSDWIIRLYKNGILFYFYLFAISLANILVPLLAPRVFANWLATPQRVIHSVLCTRVLLLIFKQRSNTMVNRLPSSMRHGHHSARPGGRRTRFDLNAATFSDSDDARFSTMIFETIHSDSDGITSGGSGTVMGSSGTESMGTGRETVVDDYELAPLESPGVVRGRRWEPT